MITPQIIRSLARSIREPGVCIQPTMMRRKGMFSVLALLAPLAVVAVVASPTPVVSEASATLINPSLCTSVTQVCEYQPIEEAPALNTNVCWDGFTTTLMGAGGCTGDGRAFSISHGIVLDPVTNVVLPIAGLIDTCPRYCTSGGIDAGTILTDGVACCSAQSSSCTAPDQNGVCSKGDITWCKKLEDNDDGTVTCHE